MASSFVAGTLLPDEHLHESDAAHPSATVHRHLALEEHHSDDPDEARLDHADARVVWLTAAWLHQSAVHIDQPAGEPSAVFLRPTAATRRLKRRADDVAPTHGPPRAPRSLRAPPANARLI
ncbi:MAG TPA: hypothetical protein VN716_27630 [Vicinamibacterales bacterium]|nr:hypothetical protein [Vicinamibacterales bacterium]